MISVSYWFKRSIAICLVIPLAVSSAQAETEEERRDRIERLEQLRRTEEVTGEAPRIWSEFSKRLGWWADYGGTARGTYTGGDNNARNAGSGIGYSQDAIEFTKDYELNLFLNLVDFTRKSKFYTRLRSTYTERKKNSGTSLGNDWVDLEVDLMYYERKYKAAGSNTTLTLGRQYFSTGRGIAYSAAGDGIIVNTNYKRYDINLFAAKADRSPDDLDPGNLSPPNRGHTHRDYIGGEFKANISPKVSPYIFYVKGKDRGDRTINTQTNQVHVYQPTFNGYGANGSIIPRLTYFAEFIRVHGSTTSVGDRQDTTPVDAKAYNVGMRYRFGGRLQPTLAYERAYASGDPDRQSTVNSTNLGNTFGPDQVFRPVGGLSLGYAFAPTFANLKVRKVSGGVSPFATVSRFKYKNIQNIRLDADFYEYRRDQIAGPISDLAFPNGAAAREKLGTELDLQMNWQPISDVRLSVRWGKFVPGPAFRPLITNQFGQSQNVSVDFPEIYWRIQCTIDI